MAIIQPILRFKNFNYDFSNISFGDIIVNYGYGPRFNGDDYSDEGNVKTIRGTDISTNGEIKYSQVPLANLDYNFIKGHILEEGDLVMITTADCGLTGVYRKQEIDFIPSAYAVKIKLDDKNDPYFFKYFLQTKIAYKQVDKYIRKATVANLPCSDILKFQFKIPLIEEQNKIANFLSSVDNKINQLFKRKVLLEKYIKGIMQQIFNQEIRFKDDNDNDYEDWNEFMLSEVATFRRGSFPQPYGLPKWYDNDKGMPFVQVFDVDDNMLLKSTTKNKISSLGAEQSVFVKKGGLIITIQGSIGRIAKIQYDAYVDRTILIFQEYKVNINVDYFKYVVFLLFEIEKEKAPGGIIKTITKEDLSSFNVMVPCLSEQTKIANFLSAIDIKINHIKIQLKKTQEFKDGLLQQMFM